MVHEMEIVSAIASVTGVNSASRLNFFISREMWSASAALLLGKG